MFEFQAGKMYQMPVQFGPCSGPRQAPDGGRFPSHGPQDYIGHILVYETMHEALEPYLPQGFSLRSPHVIVTHKMHRNLPWLAGRGYNVVTFDVPVIYHGEAETIPGVFLLAIWENHADPILCGREQLGYSKIFAEIEDIHVYRAEAEATLSSWNFPFLKLHWSLEQPPADELLLKEILQDPQSMGKLHYKYIPRTGDGFSRADVAYVTLSPKESGASADLPPLPQAKRSWCSGSLEWTIPQWEDMPTQYHIVQALASLPVVHILGASKVVMQHYSDVYGQRMVR